ncbi:MAG: hypothetical protein WCO23_00625 [bacterium]
MKNKFDFGQFAALLIAILIAECIAANYSQTGALWILIPGALVFLLVYYFLMFVFGKITKNK